MPECSNLDSPVFNLKQSESDWLIGAPMWESDVVGSFKLQPSFLSEPGIVLISLVKQKQYIGRSWWQWKTAPLWGNTCSVTSITVIDIKQTNTVCRTKCHTKTQGASFLFDLLFSVLVTFLLNVLWWSIFRSGQLLAMSTENKILPYQHMPLKSREHLKVLFPHFFETPWEGYIFLLIFIFNIHNHTNLNS